MQKRVSDLHDPLFSQEYACGTSSRRIEPHFPARSVAHCAPLATPGPWYNTIMELYEEIWLNSTCIAVSVDEISKAVAAAASAGELSSPDGRVPQRSSRSVMPVAVYRMSWERSIFATSRCLSQGRAKEALSTERAVDRLALRHSSVAYVRAST